MVAVVYCVFVLMLCGCVLGPVVPIAIWRLLLRSGVEEKKEKKKKAICKNLTTLT